jgi:hypothetical protein
VGLVWGFLSIFYTLMFFEIADDAQPPIAVLALLIEKAILLPFSLSIAVIPLFLAQRLPEAFEPFLLFLVYALPFYYGVFISNYLGGAINKRWFRLIRRARAV